MIGPTDMPTKTSLTPDFTVSPALTDADFSELSALGFKSVLNVRPDGETASQLASADAARAARAAGLAYAHIPVRKHDLFADEIVSEAARTLADLPAPVLAYCASGQRAVILWAAASARSQPVPRVLETLKDAGYDFEFLRDDLDAQADRARWSNNATEAAENAASIAVSQPEAKSAERAAA